METLTLAAGMAMVGLFLWDRRGMLQMFRREHGVSMMQGVILFGVILVALTAAVLVLTGEQAESVSRTKAYTGTCNLDGVVNGTLPATCASA